MRSYNPYTSDRLMKEIFANYYINVDNLKMYKILAWRNGLHTLRRDLTVLVCVLTLDLYVKSVEIFYSKNITKKNVNAIYVKSIRSVSNTIIY